MTLTSKVITVTGIVLLSHACYSAQEHHALTAGLTSSQTTAPTLPLDITIEAIFSTLLTCLGLAISAPSLRPIQWNVWAGKIERDGSAGFVARSSGEESSYRGNPFGFLDARPNFVDIRKQRKDFAGWVKSQDEGKQQ